MYYLALAQSSPGLFYGVCIYILILILFVKKHRIKKDVFFNYCLGVILIITALVGQAMLEYDNVIIEGMVSDQDLRQAVTKGTYSMENGINTWFAQRSLFFATISMFFYMLFDRTQNTEAYLLNLVKFALASFFLIFVLANIFGATELKLFLSNFSSLDSNNYLTTDQFGYRISGFFHEPSHSSVVIGTSLGAIFVVKPYVISRIMTFVALLIIFCFSRSITIFFVFFISIYFLYANKLQAIIGIFSVIFIQAAVTFIANYYSGTGLFRSVYERTFKSEVFNSTPLNTMFGYDFGQVYSFEPFYGVALQLGILGVVALYFLAQRDIRTFGFATIIFSVVPQMWHYPAWFAIGFFMVTLKSKQKVQEF